MIKEQLDATLESLKQQRDELRVQLHLLGMEAREEWEEAERTWERLGNTLRRIEQEGAYQAHEMVESFRQIAQELKQQYRRLRPEERLAESVEGLRQLRDELRLQTRLMSMEAREEWEEAEQAWNKLHTRLDALADKSGKALEEATEAARKLQDEIAARYAKIRERIKG